MEFYHRSQYNLKGLVKSAFFKSSGGQALIKEVDKNISINSLKKSYFVNTDNFIDENKNLHNDLIFNEFGLLSCCKSFLSATYFFYDELHRVIESKTFMRNTEKPSEIEKYVYDIKGRLDEKTEWDHTNSYDEFATELLFNDKGRFTRLQKYIYSNENLLVEVREYWDELKYKCISTKKYKYDSQNNIIEIQSYWEDSNSIIIHRNSEYDSKNLLIKKWWNDRSAIGIVESHRSFSDYDENIIIRSETTNWSHTKKTTTVNFNYNDFNDPITVEIVINKQYPDKETLTEIISYDYVYDDNNNWIEKEEFISGVCTNRSAREIEYFI